MPGMSGARYGWWMRSSKQPRSASSRPVAKAAVTSEARLRMWIVSALENVCGTRFLASGVLTSKSGMSVTRRTFAGSGTRRQRTSSPTNPAAVKPPNTAGAALSGCPSRAATSSSRPCRSSGLPCSAFSPATQPSRAVTLDPSPRAMGTSPDRWMSMPKRPRRVFLKNASAASSSMANAPARAASAMGEVMSMRRSARRRTSARL